MEQLETKNLDIVRLFLEKLENLNEDERRVLIKSIDIINHTVFLVDASTYPPTSKRKLNMYPWNLAKIREEYPKAEIIETTEKGRYGARSEKAKLLFRYFELRLKDKKDTVYFHREPREGYEHLRYDNRPIEELPLTHQEE